MKTVRVFSSVIAVAILCVATATAQAIAIRGGTVHTLAGPPIEGGTVVVENGLISAVGANFTIPVGAEVIDASGSEVYPGFFDALTQLGLTEVGAVDVTNDVAELGEYNPHLLASWAVHPASEHIPVARANGITHTVSAPGGGRGGGSTMAGQGSLLHTNGWTVEEMTIEPSVGIVVGWPNMQLRSFDFATMSMNERTYREAREEYDGKVTEIDGWIDAARNYQAALDAGTDVERDLKLEALTRVTTGELPFLVMVNAERGINAVLDFAERNGVRVIILGGADAWKVADRLADANVPVILGPTQDLPGDEDYGYDQVYSAPGQLHAAGVKIGFGTFGASASRNLPYEVGSAVSFGLPREEAIRAITINNAEIFGVGDRLGTIETGKIANLIVTDGDPLEIRTQILHLVVNGQIVPLDNKHLELYERYRGRPRRP
jgi:imidazolonepropionase-like amidohydrolase